MANAKVNSYIGYLADAAVRPICESDDAEFQLLFWIPYKSGKCFNKIIEGMDAFQSVKYSLGIRNLSDLAQAGVRMVGEKKTVMEQFTPFIKMIQLAISDFKDNPPVFRIIQEAGYTRPYLKHLPDGHPLGLKFNRDKVAWSDDPESNKVIDRERSLVERAMTAIKDKQAADNLIKEVVGVPHV